jgi:dihydrofolate reductase
VKRLRYSVAASLDGYIADPDGGYDWIVMDPDIDFAAMADEFDTYVMGRGTYEVTIAGGHDDMMAGSAIYVVSTTLDPTEHPRVTVIETDVVDRVRALKDPPGKDIWLFGGGVLFRTLLEAGLVDTVEVAVIPVLLGRGIPLLPGLDGRARLRLEHQHTYPKSGIAMLYYSIIGE